MGRSHDTPEPPSEDRIFTAFCKSGGKKVPVYVYRSFLAAPDALIWRSAIENVKPVLRDNGQWAGYPESWDLVITVEGESPAVLGNFTADEVEKLHIFLKDWLP
jgi:hypothetical protein